jgi:predicted anti-sigma-YlaC factor YlaD
MSYCPDSDRLEAYFDGDLAADDADAVRAHVDGCRACRVELAALARVVECVRVAAVRDPGPALTERILDRVLPSRLRRRWVTAIGWAYGATTAVCTYALISWVSQPETPKWVVDRVGEGSLRALQAGLFTLNAIAFSWLRALDGWAVIAPFLRALSRPLADPVIVASIAGAVLACIATLWWMHARRDPVTRKVDHVGLLGF